MNTQKFWKRFKRLATQVSSEFEQFLDEVKVLAPTNIMEIGTDRGGAFHALGLLASRDGLKISLDIPRFGRWAGFDYAGLHRRMKSWFPGVQLIHADSHVPSTQDRVVQALGGRKLDLLFIDGDHSYEGVSMDYRMYSPLVRAGGVIAFHDIVDSPSHRAHGCEVSRFWNEVGGVKREIIKNGSWGGIGVIVKPPADLEPTSATNITTAA